MADAAPLSVRMGPAASKRSLLTRPEEQSAAAEVLSQDDYRATPYEATQWEVIGERVKDEGFIAMELEVMRDARADADPMFADFNGEESFRAGDTWESPGGISRKKKQQQAEEETPQIDEQMLQEFGDQRFAEGRSQGYAAGCAETEQKIIDRYEMLSQRLSAFTASAEKKLEAHYRELEKRSFQLAISIARKLIESTVEARPDYIVGVIRSGLHSLGAAHPVRIRVSAQDFEFLELIGLPADLTPTELGVQYAADESIKSGCIIETDYGEVNLEIDRMWEQIKDSLFAVCS